MPPPPPRPPQATGIPRLRLVCRYSIRSLAPQMCHVRTSTLVVLVVLAVQECSARPMALALTGLGMPLGNLWSLFPRNGFTNRRVPQRALHERPSVCSPGSLPHGLIRKTRSIGRLCLRTSFSLNRSLLLKACYPTISLYLSQITRRRLPLVLEVQRRLVPARRRRSRSSLALRPSR